MLTDFVDLRFSPVGASPKEGTAIFNEVDAGVAALEPSISFVQGYLPFRGLVAPQAIASALPGDRVFKVGRTTGLTIGEAIGMVFAGNSRQTYACSIETALDALKCSLV